MTTTAMRLQVAFAGLLAYAMISIAHAGDVYWTVDDAVNTNWWFSNKNNWSTGEFPSSGDKAWLRMLNQDGRTSMLELRSGDSVSLQALHLRCNKEGYTSLYVPAGASMSLAGGSENPSFVSGWESSHALLDIAGGSISCAGNFYVSGGPVAGQTYGVLRVRDSGELKITQGVFTLQGNGWDGNLADGRIELLSGGTLKFEGSAYGVIGEMNISAGQGQGAGTILVDGGKIDTLNRRFYVHAGSQSKTDISLKDGSIIFKDPVTVSYDNYDFEFRTQGKQKFAQSGGLLSGDFSLQSANANVIYEMTGGKVRNFGVLFGTSQADSGGRLTMRFVGAKGDFDLGAWQIHSSVTRCPNHVFHDFRITADNTEGEFGVTPIHMLGRGYTYGENRAIQGHWRISPQGGFAFVNRDLFLLMYKTEDGNSAHYNITSHTGKFFDSDLFDYNVRTQNNHTVRSEKTWFDEFDATLRADAELSADVTLPANTYKGWVRVPTYSGKLLGLSVRLQVSPQNGKTLEDIVAGMVSAGYAGAKVASADSITVPIPLDTYAKNPAGNKLLFNFSEVEGIDEATSNTQTVFAHIQKVTFLPEKPGLLLIFR